jgi:hypothetical protein
MNRLTTIPNVSAPRSFCASRSRRARMDGFSAAGALGSPRDFIFSPAQIIRKFPFTARPRTNLGNKSKTLHRNLISAARRRDVPPGVTAQRRCLAGGRKRFHWWEFLGLRQTGRGSSSGQKLIRRIQP